MPGLLLSAALEKAVSEIMSTATSNFMQVECILSSPTDAKVAIALPYIKSLDIVQDFSTAYADMIELDIELAPDDYLLAIDNYQDLKCTIHLYAVNKITNKRLNRILTFDSRFVFKNRADLLKNYSRASLVPAKGAPILEKHRSLRIPITAQLMDPVVYDARRTQVNFVARNVTMEDTIHLLTDMIGIKKLYLVPPDNTTIFGNMIIPPMLSIAEAYGYLQGDNGKGVYYKGFNYYVTNGVLYVYPMYEVNPTSPKTVNIYRIGKNAWLGADSYHIYKNGDLHFVSNTEAANKDSIELNLENYGSMFLIQNGKQIPDNWTYINKKSQLQIADAGVRTVTTNSKAGVITDSYIPKFKFSSDNAYTHTSELASNNVVIMQAGWKNAVPFSFIPGWKCIVHYDGSDDKGNGIYTTRTGTCIGVVYSITPVSRLTERNYACSANFRLQLSPDEDIVKAGK